MTHTPLTKAERGSILADCFATGYYAHEISRLCADLAAAEAERDALRKIAVDCCNATDGMCTMGVSIEFLSHVPKEVALLKANRNMIAAQRDRAESERDAAEALHNSVMVDLAACVCRAEESDARVRNGEGAVRDVIAQRDRAESELDEIKTALGVMGATRERALEVAGSQDELEERIDSMSRERDVALKGWSAAEAARDDAAAQRDRAESERDSERKLRVEAEAAATRAEAESATFSRRLAEALVRNDEDDLGCDRARMEEMRDERDALKAQEGEWADQISAALNSTADKLGRTPSMIAGHVRREHEAHTACFDRLRKAVDERDALKARLADLSEADEELHTCRALVNATSENLSVDLERMVDDLAEANEKAARSEKDSHSWHELYKDTKAKLAALVEAATSAETILGNMAKETGRVFGRWEINHEPLRNDAQRMLPSFRAAIAAARGGAT